MKDIIFYRKENWDEPVLIFLDVLKWINQKLLVKILYKIELLSEWKIWNDDVKYIWENIYELRIKQSSNISRIFYFTYEWNTIVLLDWIIKKDNKLNSNVLKIIKTYKKDFLKRIW